jgi:hypothetical protein
MSRLVLWPLLVVCLVGCLVGCSTRSVVVQPDEVSKLNDPQWTITSKPASRPQ